jgi:ribonuclease P protein component
VARNRVKRRLRELCRTRLLPADVAADLVIRIRPEAYRAPFVVLAAEIDRVLAQLVSWRAGEPELSPVLDRPAAEMSDDT